MKSADKCMVEADVYINDTKLDFGQSMTLRVALGSFLMCCDAPELGSIGPLYAARCREIMAMIFKDIKSQGAPSLRDAEIGTEQEIRRLEEALRWIKENHPDTENNLHDSISRALRGKSVP